MIERCDDGRQLVCNRFVLRDGATIWMHGGSYDCAAMVDLVVVIGEWVRSDFFGDQYVHYPNPWVRVKIEGETFASVHTNKTRLVELKHYPNEPHRRPDVYLPAEGVRLANEDHALLFTEALVREGK